MNNPEKGSRKPEDEIPQQEQSNPDLSESGAELDLNLEGPDTHPEETRSETRMDTMEKEIEQRCQERLLKLKQYEDQIRHEFGLKPADLDSELKKGESADEDLDVLLQAIYKKREEIKQDREEAIKGLMQQLKEGIDEI